MLKSKIFIFKLVAVYTKTSCAIMVHEITTLAHESFDHSMEETLFVPHGFVIDTGG